MRSGIKKIIQEYVIDKKIARYVLRPIYEAKNIPVGAFLLCAKPEDRLRIAEEMFVVNLGKIDDFTLFLVDVGKRYGMDEGYVRDCIHDDDTYKKIIYMQQNNREVFSINVTPMLIINNQERVGYQSYEQIRDFIESILNGVQR
jgi:hypothetical protein